MTLQKCCTFPTSLAIGAGAILRQELGRRDWFDLRSRRSESSSGKAKNYRAEINLFSDHGRIA